MSIILIYPINALNILLALWHETLMKYILLFLTVVSLASRIDT